MTLMMLGAAGVVGSTFGGPAGSAPALMALCPMSFVVIGVFLIVHLAKKASAYANAPIIARLAIVVGKRTAVSGGGKNSSASTSYFITVELEDGQREELQPMAHDFFGRVAENDAGVLFSRAKIALDFDRVML